MKLICLARRLLRPVFSLLVFTSMNTNMNLNMISYICMCEFVCYVECKQQIVGVSCFHFDWLHERCECSQSAASECCLNFAAHINCIRLSWKFLHLRVPHCCRRCCCYCCCCKSCLSAMHWVVSFSRPCLSLPPSLLPFLNLEKSIPHSALFLQPHFNLKMFW